MKKKIISLFAAIMCAAMLTGCGGNKEMPLLGEDGDWIHYSEEEMAEGYHIWKESGQYYRILPIEAGESNLGNKFLWFCEPYDAAIPHFTNRDKLMFYSETERPKGITLYKMTDYGYTLGIQFKVENNAGDLKHPQIISFKDNYNPQSQVGEVIKNVVTANAETYITGISGHELTANLMVDDSFLKGLTKDAMYPLEIYCGTVRKTVNVKADTHLFLQEATYSSTAYEELKAKTFQIYLPQNLAPGYYYLDGVGIFYYEGTIQSIDDDDIESILENQDDESGSSESSQDEETYTDDEPIGDVDNPNGDEEPIGDVDEPTGADGGLDGLDDLNNPSEPGDEGDAIGDVNTPEGEQSSSDASVEGSEG